MIIDVRGEIENKITEIRFRNSFDAQSLQLGDGGAFLSDGDGYTDLAFGNYGFTKEDVRNFIKALEKAIDLGWFE